MPKALRRHLTYVNVTALVLSLTAGAFAAVRITGKEVVDGSLSGKEIRPESIRSKHVRGLTLRDLKNGPGPYYLRSVQGQGNGIASAEATCNNNDAAISGGTVAGGIGTYLLGDGPDGFNPNTRVATSWAGRVQGTSGSQSVRVTVTVLCLAVPAD